MKEKLKKYIEINLLLEAGWLDYNDAALDEYPSIRTSYKTINTYIEDNKDGNIFQKLLFEYIDKKGLKDSDVYNKVNIDRRLFSKIRSDSNYHPSKETIILLGLSLELNEEEIEKLLGSSSYFLPKNNYFDLIIRFCFIEGIYNLMDVNELLEEYGCKVLY